jgi:IclR family transcriptional regulator, KDG regulon repressor
VSTETVSSVQKAARLLCAFTRENREFGVRELARRLGLGKSATHRLLTTLAAEHLIEQDGTTGRYRLGIKIYELGTLVPTHQDLHEAAAICIDELHDRTRETVQVAVLDGAEVVYIERREGVRTLTAFDRFGHRNFANCTATGKMLLAWLPQPDLERILAGDLPARTRFSITDPGVLVEQLEQARRLGYAENVQESDPEIASVAAPIRGPLGAVVAAISVAGPLTTLTGVTRRRFVAATIETASRISERLGYRPEPAPARGV